MRRIPRSCQPVRLPGCRQLAILTVGLLLTVPLVRGAALAATAPDPAALLQRLQVLTSAAADSIARWFAVSGLRPAFATGWFQDFELSGEAPEGTTGRNVAGILPGRGELADRWIVVGAHYDHLGRTEPGEGIPSPGAYFPGANDNASGVAVLLELVRLAASETTTPVRGCLFVSFDAEEIGLQGSAQLVRDLPVPRGAVDAMLNFDCVGRPAGERLYVGGTGTTAAFAEALQGANAGGLELILSPGGWAGSDHVVFSSAEIPVLFFFTGPYPEYNRPEDDWPTLDVPGMVQVTSFAARVLASLRAHPGALPYIAVSTVELRPPAGDTPPRRAWLGTIPDFAAQDSAGVRLAGVIDGSPAQRAGLAKGDLLLRMAGRPVVDLAGLTEILRDCAPGQAVDLQILREGRRLEYLVVLADRSERR
jgi:hypothetical protein